MTSELFRIYLFEFNLKILIKIVHYLVFEERKINILAMSYYNLAMAIRIRDSMAPFE